ncbi:MAG: B-box zinc finger protein [Anaerolineales bacterium]|nr:B-box zinc finger protein [Anaerolineales bacterium]
MSDDPPVLYCATHPDVETSLRCNNCGKPICPKCAVRTPTGYRCKECMRSQQKVFDTAEWIDYPLAIVVACILSYLGSTIVGYVGFFTLFIAPIAGVLIAEAVRFVVRRRRSRNLFVAAAIAAAVGSLPNLLISLAGGLLGFRFYSLAILPLIWQALYTFTVTTAVYYRLRGIDIR